MTYPEGFGPPPSTSSASIPVSQASRPLYESKGWMKLLGVISIVSGGLSALSIIGIVFAWLPIWLGVLLWKAGNAVEAAHEAGDAAQFLDSQSKLKTYFMITGIVALIGIILSVLVILLFGAAFLAAYRNGITLE